MAKYAPGGEMDRIERHREDIYSMYLPENNGNNKSSGIGKFLIIALIIAAVYFFVSPTLVDNPITIENQVVVDTGDGINANIYFTLTNNSPGFILKPSYTVKIVDQAGTIAFNDTVQIGSYLSPKEEKNLSTTVPACPGGSYSLEVHYKALKPF